MKNLIKLVLALVFLISVTSAVYYPYKTTTSLRADISMGNHKLTDLAAPTASNDASTKGYVDDHWGIGGGTAAVFMITGDGLHNMSIPTGWNDINIITNLDWVQYDSMNGWDAVNNKYIAQVAGKYFITASVPWLDPWDGNASYASIIKNGAVAVSGINVMNSYCYGPTVAGIVDLDVGDYVQLSVCQDSGTTMTVAPYSQLSFQGFFLGL